MSPQNPYVEDLTPSVTIFGERAFKEVTKVEEVIRVWPDLIELGACKKRHQSSLSLSLCTGERPRENTERRWQSTIQGESSSGTKPNGS